jgi:tetratricopeptide (TPR) repeat protein
VAEAIREYQLNARVARKINADQGAGYGALAEGLFRAGRVKDLEALLLEYDRAIQKDQLQDQRENRNFIAGLLALAKGRSREAVAIFEKNTPFGPTLVHDWRRHWALARALLAAGDKDRAIAELGEVVKRAPGGGDPIEAFKAMNMLAKLYEERGRREDALALYRRVARQYRQAEPGVKANEEALAGIQRLTKAPS